MQTTEEQQAAGAITSGAGAPGAGRYLTFTLKGEVYALDIRQITEIIEFKSLTVVPMMPAFIRGVINLRGRVLPVVDLAERFDRGATAVGRRTGVIVVETSAAASGAGLGGGSGDDAGQGIGVMVDAVNKVVHLGDDDIKAPPAFGTGIRCDFISGMAKYDGEFIIVLDIARVLSTDDLGRLGNEGGAAAPGVPVEAAAGG